MREELKVRGKEVEDIDKLTYLGAVMDKSGGSDKDLDATIGTDRSET